VNVLNVGGPAPDALGEDHDREWPMARQISIESPLPPQECARRLGAAVVPELAWADAPAAGGRLVVGRVEPPELHLRVEDPRYGNAFQPVFAGRIEPGPDGTTITGTFRMRRFVQVYMAVWFGMGTLMAVLTVLTMATGGAPAASGDERATLAGLGALLIAGFLATHLGQWLARAEPSDMLTFLRSTIEAPA
jgi:hypothetical protein